MVPNPGHRAWLTLGIAGVVALALFLVALVAEVAIPLAIAAVLAAILVPVADRLERWHVPRWLGATFVLIVALSIVVATGALVVRGITSQSDEIWARLQASLDHVDATSSLPVSSDQMVSTAHDLVRLQKANGLPVPGAVDKATAAALQAELVAKGGAAAQQSLATTAAVQQTLKLAGFWDGPVDGTWTPALTEAVKEFQTQLGVKPTGTVDTATVQALEKAIAGATQPSTSPDSQGTSPSMPTTAAPASPTGS